jgi:mannose-6-phosphate isomerase-like protein (cupin superfamily)
MADYTVKRIDEIEAVFGGAFKRARADLGVTAFGMQIIDMPPNNDRHPEHDHSHDGQEEVYVVLRGSAEVDIEGERVAIDPETLLRVAPGTKRKVLPGDQGVRLLALGGKPGAAYEAPDMSKLGAPDPMASS